MATKVSIVIPTYKRPALLKRCIDSLLSQDFPKEEFEIIIITDGPDEETLSMVQQFTCNTCFKNISFYCLPSKKGPAAARNAGWKIGKGRLILFTDDDCIAHKDWVKYYFNAFEFHAEPFIAFTGRIIVPRSSHPTDFELNTAHLEHADFVTANCACSKMALEKVNGFDEAFTMAWREDSDLEFKFIKQDIPISKIEEAVIIHPVRKAPWGMSLKEQKKSMFNALLFKKHPRLYRERISSSILWNYYLMIFLFVAFFIEWHNGKKIIAIICISTWTILLGLFVSKRLSNASRSFNHVTEMIATSILIPFISVFWNLYGAYKFKALRL